LFDGDDGCLHKGSLVTCERIFALRLLRHLYKLADGALNELTLLNLVAPAGLLERPDLLQFALLGVSHRFAQLQL